MWDAREVRELMRDSCMERKMEGSPTRAVRELMRDSRMERKMESSPTRATRVHPCARPARSRRVFGNGPRYWNDH